MRYYLKLRSTARALRMALTAVQGTTGPVDIIALAEVESYFVVEGLSRHAALADLGPWSVVHFDSKDHRGIDCAALLRTDRCRLLEARPISANTDSLTSRDALLMTVRSPTDSDSLDWQCMVVHLSSKRGGASASNWKRSHQMRTFTEACRDLPAIIIGDMNDGPSATFLTFPSDSPWQQSPSLKPLGLPVGGTYKFQGRWSTIDQAIYRGPQPWNHQIIALAPLLKPDEKWSGWKPYRTWQGSFYIGGYSDHLPIHAFMVVN
ncbi:MAG: hypothetical protein RL754_169 [Bacteroidota bacterium]